MIKLKIDSINIYKWLKHNLRNDVASGIPCNTLIQYGCRIYIFIELLNAHLWEKRL